MRRLSCVATLVVITLLMLGTSIAAARNQADNDKAAQNQAAPLQTVQKLLAQDRAAEDQGAQDQPAQDQGAQEQQQQPPPSPPQPQQQPQQQGVATLPIPYVTTVSIRDGSFEPPDITVAPLTAVLWVNEGAEPHTVTADDGSFDSMTLNPGQFFVVVFDGQGTTAYHCALHPEMVGSVTVSDDSGDPASTQESQAPAEASQAPAEQQYAEQQY